MAVWKPLTQWDCQVGSPWGQGKPGHLLPFLIPFSYASALLSPFHALLPLPLPLGLNPVRESAVDPGFAKEGQTTVSGRSSSV